MIHHSSGLIYIMWLWLRWTFKNQKTCRNPNLKGLRIPKEVIFGEDQATVLLKRWVLILLVCSPDGIPTCEQTIRGLKRESPKITKKSSPKTITKILMYHWYHWNHTKVGVGAVWYINHACYHRWLTIVVGNPHRLRNLTRNKKSRSTKRMDYSSNSYTFHS